MKTTRPHKIAVLLLLFCLLSIGPAFAITGHEWLSISKDGQHLYVVGTLSGWKTAELMCKQAEENCMFIRTFIRAISCFEAAPFSDYVAIVRQYVQEHPGRRNDDMALTIWMAIGESCQARQ